MPDKDKGISRIDSGKTHGWFVRGYRNGKTWSKLFSDQKHGGREAALDQAREFRKKLASDLQQLPAIPRARRVVTRNSRNTTGVIGVSRTRKKSSSGNIHECYSVSWRTPEGVPRCTSFSIRKYGEEEAFRRAVALRRDRMRLLQQGKAPREGTP